MSEWALQSLLPRGTKTWYKGGSATTIDLVLATEGLAEAMIRYAPTITDHGLDHCAIETTFDIARSSIKEKEKLLLKNAP